MAVVLHSHFLCFAAGCGATIDVLATCTVFRFVLQGLEAILRVRCSAGLDVEGYLGDFHKPANSPTDLYLPAIDCDKAMVAKLAIVEKLNPNSEVRWS